MEYDITKIRALCDMYFEGETSTEEEKLLAARAFREALAALESRDIDA